MLCWLLSSCIWFLNRSLPASFSIDWRVALYSFTILINLNNLTTRAILPALVPILAPCLALAWFSASFSSYDYSWLLDVIAVQIGSISATNEIVDTKSSQKKKDPKYSGTDKDDKTSSTINRTNVNMFNSIKAVSDFLVNESSLTSSPNKAYSVKRNIKNWNHPLFTNFFNCFLLYSILAEYFETIISYYVVDKL